MIRGTAQFSVLLPGGARTVHTNSPSWKQNDEVIDYITLFLYVLYFSNKRLPRIEAGFE